MKISELKNKLKFYDYDDSFDENTKVGDLFIMGKSLTDQFYKNKLDKITVYEIIYINNGTVRYKPKEIKLEEK
ncbi:MAG: hypothetical protein ACOCP4_00905 [Candidatus Woesearchaeota archaeon]